MVARTEKGESGRDFLVLWKWEEALRVRGIAVRSARGKHSGGLNPGDRIFLWAVHGEELYVLGAIRVTKSEEDWAEGRSLYGPFKIIPLGRLKWRLRFQYTEAEKLSRETPIAMQVRARRRPTPTTVVLVDELLSDNPEDIERLEKDSAVREGRQLQVTLSRRERSRKLRSHLLATRGHLCEICGFDFVKSYGEFAKHCVEIHHLEPVSSSGRHGRMTSLEDLLVVCPNCHRALHQFGNTADWKAFQRACNLA